MITLEPDARSYWAPYTTHFRALGSYIEPQHLTAVVLGASDGKFALPLAAEGMHVTAVDLDTVFLFGGEVQDAVPPLRVAGLQQHVRASQLEKLIKIVVADFMTWPDERTFDVVVTSGSWSMPENHRYDFDQVVERTASRVAAGGLLMVDFLSAIADERPRSHYPPIESVQEQFPSESWEILECVSLGIQQESHYDAPELHSHLFGALIAKRRSDRRHVRN